MSRAAERRQESAALAVLRAVHRDPGVERAAAARESGLASGFVAETVARLRQRQLVSELPARPTGGRGRPTTTLHPHPSGPLVIAGAIAHENWRISVVELGGRQVSQIEQSHRRDAEGVLTAMREELGAIRRRHGRRIRSVAIAVPGTVSGKRLVQAPMLDWNDLDLGVLWSRDRANRPLVIGNDATFAGIAEATRGAAVGASTSLHLFMDAGIGGAVVEHGQAVTGANGMAGEFGHMPFGDPMQLCRCGARGCWNTMLDGAAIARALGRGLPVDEVTFVHQVMAAATKALGSTDQQSPELTVVQEMARSLGRGVAGLVNAMDPAVVTLGGMGRDLLAVADVQFMPAYQLGLMQLRTSPPPLVVPGHFGNDAPIVGAVEEAFAAFLTEDGLLRWSEPAH